MYLYKFQAYLSKNSSEIPRLHNHESGLWSSLSVSLTGKGPDLMPVKEGLEPRVGLTARA